MEGLDKEFTWDVQMSLEDLVKSVDGNLEQGYMRVWDNKKTIGSCFKGGRSKVEVAIAAKDGVKYLQIAELYYNKTRDEWFHSNKRIAIAVRMPTKINDTEAMRIIEPCKEFMDLVHEAVAQLDDLSLIAEDGMVIVKSKGLKRKEALEKVERLEVVAVTSVKKKGEQNESNGQ